MTIKKSAVLCLMLLLQAWPSYAADSKSHNDFLFHLDTGLSSSMNIKKNIKDNAGNSAIFGAGIKYRVTPKIKIGAAFAYRPGYEYRSIYNITNSTKVNSTHATIIPSFSPSIPSIHHELKYIGDSTTNINVDNTQKFNVASFMINASYDFTKIGDKITPYTEIGMGVSRIQQKNNVYFAQMYSRKSFNRFAMNVGGGLIYEADNNIDIDISYKYNDFGKIKQLLKDPSTNDTSKGRIKANELMLSLHFKM